MNYAQSILNALKGRACDHLPCAPRLDLWYQANERAGTLPTKYRGAELIDILEDLDVGFNATTPDFRRQESPSDEAYRAFGLYQGLEIFYRVGFEVDHRSWTEGDRRITEFSTPYGKVRASSVYTDRMKDDGITVSHVDEHAFKGPEDYRSLAYVYSRVRVEPAFDRIARMEERTRGRGPVVGWGISTASPMHFIQKQLMKYDQFFYELYDHPDELAELARSIAVLEDRILEVMIGCPVEIIRIGGNYDSMLQNPPFFREHLLPRLKTFADRLHRAGKLLLSHTDGENDGLLEAYREAGFDIADSLCPAPMTKVSLADTRRIFDNRMAIWGGVPSVLMLKSSASDKEFEAYLDSMFEAIGDGRRFVAAIADTTPPEADFQRIKTLVRLCRDFGPVTAV